MPALSSNALSFLRSLPSSASSWPGGLAREQMAMVENLPRGLVRDGKRTDLGDFVVAQAGRLDSLMVLIRDAEYLIREHAPTDSYDI